MDPEGRPPELPVEAMRRLIAGRLLHSQLAGRRIPEHVRGIPDDMLIDRLARMDAKELLALLADLYDVPYWGREEFERVFVEGALDAWRPGGAVHKDPRGLRVVSTECPLAADVERDPRTCDLCRGVQHHVAYLSMIGEVESAEVPRVLAFGGDSCAFEVRYRRPRQ